MEKFYHRFDCGYEAVRMVRSNGRTDKQGRLESALRMQRWYQRKTSRIVLEREDEGLVPFAGRSDRRLSEMALRAQVNDQRVSQRVPARARTEGQYTKRAIEPRD